MIFFCITINHVCNNSTFYLIHPSMAESRFLTLQDTKRRKRRGFGDPRDVEVLLTETLGQMAWAMVPTGPTNAVISSNCCRFHQLWWKQSCNILIYLVLFYTKYTLPHENIHNENQNMSFLIENSTASSPRICMFRLSVWRSLNSGFPTLRSKMTLPGNLVEIWSFPVHERYCG